MKKYYACVILALLFVCGISCKKESQQAQEKKVNIHVTEYKSHAPVPGANVNVVEISLDLFSNSAIRTNVETLQTDADGICQVPESYFKNKSYAIIVSKDGFWQSDLDFSATSIPTTYELQRKSKMRVHLIQLNSYPVNTLFYMESAGELPGYTISPFSGILLPADTTFSMDVYGGQTNQVSWKVMDQFSDSLMAGNLPVDVLPTGITDMEIKY